MGDYLLAILGVLLKLIKTHNSQALSLNVFARKGCYLLYIHSDLPRAAPLCCRHWKNIRMLSTSNTNMPSTITAVIVIDIFVLPVLKLKHESNSF